MKTRTFGFAPATSRRFVRRLFAACLPGVLAFVGTSKVGAQGYEWDHPDGIGVRYLLYKKMERRKIRPEFEGSQIRAAFVPNDPSDFVRVKGAPLEWGVNVYEFTKKDAQDDESAAATLQDFISTKDPYLRTSQRKIVRDGSKSIGPVQHWEYLDRFIPPLWKSKQAVGKHYFAHCNALDVRFLIEKKMYPMRPDNKKSGPHLVATARFGYSEWRRMKGRKRKVPWRVSLLSFPASLEAPDSEHRLAAESFDQYCTRNHKNRTFTVRAKPEKGKYLQFRRYVYYDDFRQTGGSVVFHNIAADYDLGDGHAVVVMRWPAESDKIEPKWKARAEAMITSLRRGADKPGAEIGGTRYCVATACVTDGREVAVVVDIPVASGGKPGRGLLARARKIATSLRPDK